MANFFSLTKKYKALTALILLVFVLAGVSLPNPQPARAVAPLIAGGLLTYAGVKIGQSLDWAKVTATAINYIAQEISKTLQAAKDGGLSGFLISIAVNWINLFSTLCYLLATGCAWIFRYILAQMIEDPHNLFSITRGQGFSAVFLDAWNICKNWANVGIVLSLIAAAGMMVLRVWADQGKAMVKGIIITALLVNFSTVFVGLGIDASNIVMKSLAVSADRETDLVLKINHTWNRLVRPLRHPIDMNRAAQYFAFSMLTNVMYLSVALAFFGFSCMIISRYFMLALLFIVSPLAYVSRIIPLPQVNGYWNRWWSMFIGNLWVLIPALFFLRISTDILASPTINWTINSYTDLGRVLINFVVVLGFLYVGMGLAIKSFDSFTKIVLSAAKTVAKKTGSLVAKATGADKAWNWTREKGNNFVANQIESLERFGLMQTGTAATWRKQAKEGAGLDDAAKKKMDNMKAEDFKRIGTGFAYSLDAKKEKAYAIQKMAENGTLDSLSPEQQKDLIEFAIANGASSDVLTKGRADHIHLNKKAMAEEAAKVKVTRGVTKHNGKIIRTAEQEKAYREEEAKKRLKKREFERTRRSMAGEMRDMPPSELADIGKENTARGAIAREILADQGKHGSIVVTDESGQEIKFSENPEAIYQQLKNDEEAFGSNGASTVVKKSPKMAKYDKKSQINAIKQRINPKTSAEFTQEEAEAEYERINTAGNQAQKEQLQKDAYQFNIGNMKNSDIADISADEIDKDFADALNDDQKKYLRERGKGAAAKKLFELAMQNPIDGKELKEFTDKEKNIRMLTPSSIKSKGVVEDLAKNHAAEFQTIFTHARNELKEHILDLVMADPKTLDMAVLSQIDGGAIGGWLEKQSKEKQEEIKEAFKKAPPSIEPDGAARDKDIESLQQDGYLDANTFVSDFSTKDYEKAVSERSDEQDHADDGAKTKEAKEQIRNSVATDEQKKNLRDFLVAIEKLKPSTKKTVEIEPKTFKAETEDDKEALYQARRIVKEEAGDFYSSAEGEMLANETAQEQKERLQKAADLVEQVRQAKEQAKKHAESLLELTAKKKIAEAMDEIAEIQKLEAQITATEHDKDQAEEKLEKLNQEHQEARRGASLVGAWKIVDQKYRSIIDNNPSLEATSIAKNDTNVPPRAEDAVKRAVDIIKQSSGSIYTEEQQKAIAQEIAKQKEQHYKTMLAQFEVHKAELESSAQKAYQDHKKVDDRLHELKTKLQQSRNSREKTALNSQIGILQGEAVRLRQELANKQQELLDWENKKGVDLKDLYLKLVKDPEKLKTVLEATQAKQSTP